VQRYELCFGLPASDCCVPVYVELEPLRCRSMLLVSASCAAACVGYLPRLTCASAPSCCCCLPQACEAAHTTVTRLEWQLQQVHQQQEEARAQLQEVRHCALPVCIAHNTLHAGAHDMHVCSKYLGCFAACLLIARCQLQASGL
jgi:hypothetical protein